MKTTIITFLLTLITMTIGAQQKSLYDFKVEDIDGREFDMSTLRGKKVLIVNVASKCGLTPQYEELEKLYETYKDKGLVVIGFPSNDFKGQEPGTNEEIKEFCSLTYNVTFPMMSKVSVVGQNKSPIYKWLTEKAENGSFDAEVSWNFQKFMIDPNGQLQAFASPKTEPLSDEILDWINK